MKAVVTNSQIVITDVTEPVKAHLISSLSFEDKAKSYQVKRLQKSHYRNGSLIAKLQSEINQTLVSLDSNKTDALLLSSCFFDSVKGLIPDIEDHRCDTGQKMSFPWATKPHDLRDYQQEAIDLIKVNWRGLINFATGLGKTLTAIYAVKAIGRKSLIVCPGKSIAKQFYKEMCDAFGENRVGFYGDGKKKIKDITIGIAGSVNNALDEFKKADIGLIIMDEVHHVPANTFYAIASALGATGRIFGLTATDYRSDGKDLMIVAGVGDVLIRRDVVWGVTSGWLAQPYFIVREVPTVGANYRDDKMKNYKAHVLNNQLMKDRILNDIQKFLSAGKRVLCLVDEVAHGAELSTALGIPFATGEDKQSEEYVKKFNDGAVQGLVGTDGRIGEGTDTRPVDVLILANFVASKGPVVQAIGRGLRKVPGKEACVILDYMPLGSDQLTRHARRRIEYYLEITDKVRVINV